MQVHNFLRKLFYVLFGQAAIEKPFGSSFRKFVRFIFIIDAEACKYLYYRHLE